MRKRIVMVDRKLALASASKRREFVCESIVDWAQRPSFALNKFLFSFGHNFPFIFIKRKKEKEHMVSPKEEIKEWLTVPFLFLLINENESFHFFKK